MQATDASKSCKERKQCTQGDPNPGAPSAPDVDSFAPGVDSFLHTHAHTHAHTHMHIHTHSRKKVLVQFRGLSDAIYVI